MLRRILSFIGNGMVGIGRFVKNYAIEALKEILELFLNILFALRFPLIILATCFLMPTVTDLTIAVLGESFVPFGLAAVFVPFCYYSYQGIISLIDFCGYRIVDPYEERMRIERERQSHLFTQAFNRDQFNQYSNQFIRTTNPILHRFNRVDRSNIAQPQEENAVTQAVDLSSPRIA